MDKLTIAIDWTPNINHIGFFVAQAKGFYQDRSIDLNIIDPSMDNYQLTPAKKVELGMVDFALCPMESIISYRTKRSPFQLTGIASIFKEDVSAIAVLASNTIQSPSDLDGKNYASYKARYEDQIVQKMIINDGGKGTIDISYPAKLGIWETILKKQADATWIFLNWEGVLAEVHQIPLRCFKMKDFGIPYSYSPVIATDEKNITAREALFTQFLQATKQGFLHAQQFPEEAIAILAPHIPDTDQSIDLAMALDRSADYFGNASNWGIMELENVSTFLNWIYANRLESIPLQARDLVDNSLNRLPYPSL